MVDDEWAKDGFMPLDKVKAWLTSLMEQDKDVIVPVERDGKVGYENMATIGDMDVLLRFQNSHRPPKELIFPQTEVLMRYKRDKDGTLEMEETRPNMRETVVFGIRPCDAKAVHILDSVFSGFNPDPYYWDRRRKVAFIGLGCTDPHYNCFCTTVGGDPHGTEGLDILLTEVEGGLHALALTELGEDLLEAGPFLEADRATRDRAKAVHEEAVERLARSASEVLDHDDMVSVLDSIFDDEYWDDHAKKCVACGVCTYLCPTCHCFDINDEGGRSSGRRVRTWDTCQFPDFTLHTSAHNPRPVKKNRIRQRVMHKFKYMPENLGMFGCVGCGRCITHCPVNMDIFKIILGAKEVVE